MTSKKISLKAYDVVLYLWFIKKIKKEKRRKEERKNSKYKIKNKKKNFKRKNSFSLNKNQIDRWVTSKSHPKTNIFILNCCDWWIRILNKDKIWNKFKTPRTDGLSFLFC